MSTSIQTHTSGYRRLVASVCTKIYPHSREADVNKASIGGPHPRGTSEVDLLGLP
jgi:hypothetical protein